MSQKQKIMSVLTCFLTDWLDFNRLVYLQPIGEDVCNAVASSRLISGMETGMTRPGKQRFTMLTERRLKKNCTWTRVDAHSLQLELIILIPVGYLSEDWLFYVLVSNTNDPWIFCVGYHFLFFKMIFCHSLKMLE